MLYPNSLSMLLFGPDRQLFLNPHGKHICNASPLGSLMQPGSFAAVEYKSSQDGLLQEESVTTRVCNGEECSDSKRFLNFPGYHGHMSTL